MSTMMDWTHRHPSVAHFAPLFDFDHLPSGPIRGASMACAELADDAVRTLQDGPELSAGLRALLQAKDCFVRQAVLDAKYAPKGSRAERALS
jgi:hypothetical protein